MLNKVENCCAEFHQDWSLTTAPRATESKLEAASRHVHSLMVSFSFRVQCITEKEIISNMSESGFYLANSLIQVPRETLNLFKSPLYVMDGTRYNCMHLAPLLKGLLNEISGKYLSYFIFFYW